MPTRMLPVPEGLAGMRADAGIARLLGLSRTRAAAVLTDGGAEQDGRRLERSDRLEAGAVLEITWEDAAPAQVVPQEIAGMAVRYLDDDLVVVDKPVGVVAHPATSWTGPTVLGGLAALGISVAPAGPPERQGIVQRLDVGTSGLMMVARTVPAYSALKQMFREHTVDKIYHAVAHGQMDPLSGTIAGPIGRAPGSEWKFAVVAGGKPAVTHYDTLEAFRYGSLLEIHLETGRTHQIRVHLSAEHHPLMGDPLYGADPTLAARLGLTRQWLHAVRLNFDHPITGARVDVRSDYPADLSAALETLRRGD